MARKYFISWQNTVKMRQFVVLLAVLGLSLAAPSKEAENTNGTVFYRPTIGGKIVGGEATTIDQLPWQVALLRNGAQFCGGSLIGPNVVLTAAHCVAGSVISQVSQLSIRSGSSYRNSGGTRVAATRIIIHPDYQDCDYCEPDYDIAIIILASNANVGSAQVIGLWDERTTFPTGTYGIVSGWGTTTEGGLSSPTQLRSVSVPIYSTSQCRLVYGSIISSRTICAGYARGGKDSCQGDSGGPYAIQNKLAGVVSFGYGCARAGLPGVYASVPGFRAWIRQNSGI